MAERRRNGFVTARAAHARASLKTFRILLKDILFVKRRSGRCAAFILCRRQALGGRRYTVRRASGSGSAARRNRRGASNPAALARASCASAMEP
jgi:hypothetical protein